MLQYKPPVVAGGAPCMERSGAVGVERRGKQGSVGEWHERASPLCVVGAGAGIRISRC